MHLLTSFIPVKLQEPGHSLVRLAFCFCVGIYLADLAGHWIQTSQYHMALFVLTTKAFSTECRRLAQGDHDQHRELMFFHFEQIVKDKIQEMKTVLFFINMNLPHPFLFILSACYSLEVWIIKHFSNSVIFIFSIARTLKANSRTVLVMPSWP